MTSISLAQICDAIKTTLAAASTLIGKTTQSYNQLTEGINDLPCLQVFPQSGAQDPGGATDRTTFQAGTRQTSIIIYADYYARQRSQLKEDIAAVVDGIEAITAIVEQQKTHPYFGLTGIKTFSWGWERVTLIYGPQDVSYAGARFTFTLRVF